MNEPGEVLDARRLVHELAGRYGIRIDENDPAVAIVLLNQLAMEAVVEHIVDVMLARISAFDASMEKVARRGGTVLARAVKDACVQLRTELQSDFSSGRLNAEHLVYRAHRSKKQRVSIIYVVLILIAAVILAGAGFSIGRYWGLR